MKSKKHWFFSLLFILLFGSNINAQSINVSGVFPTIDHSGKINNKLEYSLYYFAAFPVVNLNKPDFLTDTYFNLLYAEQALSYHLNAKFSVTGSYVYQRENVVYDNFVNENRFYLQAKYKHVIKKVNLTHRLRFDGRFVQDRFTNKAPFTHRLRYLIGMDARVNEKVYFTAYEEAFFNTFENAAAVYGENWAYTALGIKLNDKNKIESGILYVTWKTGRQSWFNQYYFQFTWINQLDFRKKD